MVFTASLLGAQHKKRGCVENKPASLLVVSLGKVHNGMSPFLCGRQAGSLPVLDRITVVKLLTQHVAKDNSWVPTNGSPPW